MYEYDSNDDDDEYHLSQPGLSMYLEIGDLPCSRDACRTTAVNARYLVDGLLSRESL